MDCAHCHTHCEPVVLNKGGLPFCWRGCQTVYDYISDHEMLNYYHLKEQTDSKMAPATIEKNDFAYMDGEDFVNSFQRQENNHLPYLELYLEGVHCLACLWLIEKIPEYSEGIAKIQLDMSKSIAKVYLKETGHYSSAAATLNSIGYKPHPIMENKEREALKLKEERKDLLKIGVAGAFFGNIMLISVSIYAGVTGFWLEIFRWMSFALSLPVLLYSTLPFYKNAFAPLSKKIITIDLSIALTLIIGTTTGFLHTLQGHGEIYFDSLTALVFLLLMARYLLKKAQQTGLSTESLSAFYQTQSVYRQKDGGKNYQPIHPKFIKVNDIIKVPVAAYFPADGILLSEKTYSDHALLTGESLPVECH